MKRTLTPGKWRGLTTTSSSTHTFSILAFDQRGNYVKMLPEGASYTQAADIKREVVAALSPHVTAVLLDPNYGLSAALASSGNSGLLMALEKTGYSGDPQARRVDFMDGWTVAKIKQMGASAVKLLVYYHPDAVAVAEAVEAVIDQVGEACIAHDLPLFVEPLVYSLDPTGSTDSATFAADMPRLVRETARRLSALRVDVLKLEFPVNVKYTPEENAWRAACEAISEVSTVPWALLSAGVAFEVFARQVEIACRAGASGFLGGRAIWTEAVAMTAADRQTFLTSTAVQRLETLRAITDQHGRAWTDIYAPIAADENWFTHYRPGQS